MLVQFRFNDFKCFKDDTILSMVSSDSVCHKDGSYVVKNGRKVLTSAVVYGANASGKTKLFQAYHFMERMICDLAYNNKSNWQANYVPFALSEDVDEHESSFEVVFYVKDILFRYGYTVDGKNVIEEWLYRTNQDKEIEVFYRDDEGIDYNKVYINKEVAEPLIRKKMIRTDTLFLSVLATWNLPFARMLVRWFYNTNVLTGTSSMVGYSVESLGTPRKEKMLKFIRSADINIEDMFLNEANINDMPDEIRAQIMSQSKETDSILIDGVNTIHKVYDKDGLSHKSVKFNLESDESFGTAKLFSLSAPIIDTLENGKVLWVDEIDNGLHSDLLKALVALFSSPLNRYNAQLIINTHNIDLISDTKVFERDQVYIVLKNRFGESSLIPVLNFALSENDKSIGQLYREGRLGGVPYLAQFMQNVID